VDKTIPANICYEDEQVLAFEDVNPQAPTHTLVIPKRHVVSLAKTEFGDAQLLGSLLAICAKIAEQKRLAPSGYRVVVNTGADGGQTVTHLHLHILGGRPMSWPPG
jgi:histidine triad (HIT) family protein